MKKGVKTMRWKKEEVILLVAIALGVLAVIGVMILVIRKIAKKRKIKKAMEAMLLAQYEASNA